MTRHQLEEEILNLVNSADDLTYSDIQGITMAIAIKAIKE